MKRIVFILIIGAVTASLCADAAGETMAERKQRIMRKYLRERQDVVQSDMVLPMAGVEDSQVLDSEKFRQADVDLTRKQGVTPPPVQVVRPIPVPSRKNWMATDDDSDFDPNADPFAMESVEDLQGDNSDWLSEWRDRQKERAATRAVDTSATYDFSSGRNEYSSGGYTSGQQNRSSGYSSYGNTTQPAGYYGQPADRQVGPYGYSSSGSSPSGMLSLPDTPASPYGSQRSTTPGYTPYGSSYETQTEQRRPQRMQQQPQQEEFSRPTPYQQWKSDSKTWDPTADDAYLNDIMQRNRR